jgi:hypothetical protein
VVRSSELSRIARAGRRTKRGWRGSEDWTERSAHLEVELRRIDAVRADADVVLTGIHTAVKNVLINRQRAPLPDELDRHGSAHRLERRRGDFNEARPREVHAIWPAFMGAAELRDDGRSRRCQNFVRDKGRPSGELSKVKAKDSHYGTRERRRNRALGRER